MNYVYKNSENCGTAKIQESYSVYFVVVIILYCIKIAAVLFSHAELVLVVGYRMVMFQITEGKSSIDAACAPEHFDTFFVKIAQKLRGCQPKNDFGQKGR